MNSRKVNKKLKRNKYNLLFFAAIALIVVIVISTIAKNAREREIAKYDNEILIVKAGGDQIDSLTLKEIRSIGSEKETIVLNNGLEKVDIEGVAIEKIIGKLDYNLRDRAYLVVEDNEGSSRRIPMSAALEPSRVYLVYMINGTPIYDLSPSYGKISIIDSNQDSSSSWITNVKTLDIQ